jgi:hypothetical protein
VIHPSATDPAPEFFATLREQFQTALSTKLSPDPATADDPGVLKVLSVRHASNGRTYTEFQAVGVGTTIVRVARRSTPTAAKAALRLKVTVLCHP